MPRTRSRANTEEKFLNAVLELVAHDGCCALGVNAVAHKAGADKVLIYRYFGNLQGLLLRVAESRQWLPSLDELLHSLKLEADLPASEVIHPLARLLTHHIHADRATHRYFVGARRRPIHSLSISQRNGKRYGNNSLNTYRLAWTTMRAKIGND